MMPPFDLWTGNTCVLEMPEDVYRALPDAAIAALGDEGAQRWEFRKRQAPGEPWEYFVCIYLSPAAMRRLLAIARPMLEAQR